MIFVYVYVYILENLNSSMFPYDIFKTYLESVFPPHVTSSCPPSSIDSILFIPLFSPFYTTVSYFSSLKYFILHDLLLIS